MSDESRISSDGIARKIARYLAAAQVYGDQGRQLQQALQQCQTKVADSISSARALGDVLGYGSDGRELDAAISRNDRDMLSMRDNEMTALRTELGLSAPKSQSDRTREESAESLIEAIESEQNGKAAK